jgi:hypothetical protein
MIRKHDLIEIRRDVSWSAARGCWGYVNIRGWAVYLGWTLARAISRKPGWRLEW